MKMYRISEENAWEIRKRMQREKKANAYQRLQAVALRGEGRTSEEIGKITGYHPDYVGQLCKIYVTKGLDALITDGRKGGNNRKMTEADAKKFLQKYEEQAKRGQVITVKAIGKAYDEAVGKKHNSLSCAYYFLRSHGWRKIMPQRQHPGKASDEVIEASKKLTRNLKI
jgi:transposase